MSAFYDNNITDIGRLMMGDVQMGGVFTPTRIVVGSGYLPTGKTTKTVTDVVEPVKSIDLNKKEKLPNGDCVIGGVFDNKEVTTAFYFRELAIYAKVVKADGTETAETVYSYGNAGQNAELIPAYSTETAVERQLDLITYIGNDAQVNLTVESGVYVSLPTFNHKIQEIYNDINILHNSDGALSEKIQETTESLTVRIGNIDKSIADMSIRLTANETKIESKVDKEDGKGLSANDFTAAYREKVDNAVSLGETDQTAYRGDYGKMAYDHALKVNGNPHNVTKIDVGLGNVDNTPDADKPVSAATQAAMNNKANKPIYEKVTMTVAGWDKAGKTYSFEADWPAAAYDIEIGPSDDATAEQIQAYGAALIPINSSSNTAIAKGEIPEIDIPLVVKVVAK